MPVITLPDGTEGFVYPRQHAQRYARPRTPLVGYRLDAHRTLNGMYDVVILREFKGSKVANIEGSYYGAVVEPDGSLGKIVVVSIGYHEAKRIRAELTERGLL